MYKLSGQSLTRGTWFLPETQPMIIQERDSTSTITLGPEAPEIEFDDWLLDDDWQEGNYVWRVKNITDDTNTDTRTVELEHIVKTLDDITLGEVTVEMIAGSGATTCTARQAVQYILSQHDAWTLGDFEYDVSNPYEFDGETLLDALETVTDTLEHAVWEFNLSTFPFKLHVRQRDNAVHCEMRGERNLITLKRSISRSGMYTRIYPTGKNGLQVDGGYLSKNENLYGRVDHRETDQSKSTVENLQAWAQGRLNRHCEPRVTIQISGLELSQETGEPLDSLTINKVCQCPLPEYSTTITERIVKKQWRDRRKEPENVNVTLANNVTDITTIVKEQVRGGSGGRAGAGQAKQNYLFVANGEHLLYEVFDECGHVHGLLRMNSESLRIAFENLNNSTRSEFMLTAESLRIQFENELASTRSEFEMTSESLRIQFENELASTRSEFEMTSESLRIQFENEISSTRSQLEMTSESLRIQFENELASTRSEFEMTSESLRIQFENEISSTRSQFEMTSESLRIEFQNEISSTRSELQITAESLRSTISDTASGLQSQISQNAGQIALRVAKGDVGTQLAVELGNVSISGGNLVVDGYVKTTELTATFINSLFAGSNVLSANYAFVRNLECTNFTQGDYSMDLSDGVKDVKVEPGDNNTYTLYKKHFYSSDWASAGNFSRAVTSVDWSWSGGMAKAVLAPQNQTFWSKQIDIIQPHGQATWDADKKGFTMQLDVDDTEGTTVFSDEMYFNTTTSYDQGHTDGYDVAKGTYTKSNGVLKVSKSTGGTAFPISFSIDAAIVYDSSTHKYTAKALCDDDLMDTAESGTQAYDAGRTAGYNSATGSYTKSGGVLRISKGTGGTAFPISFSIDAAITYNATTHKYTAKALCDDDQMDTAESGTQAYDAGVAAGEGKFTLASVTLQGSAYGSITPIGTEYKYTYTQLYESGDAYTHYKGNGSSVTGRGTKQSINVCGNPVRFKRHTASETPSGTWYSIVSTGTGYDLTYYVSKSEDWYPGNGASVTGRGDQVTGVDRGSSKWAYVSDSSGSVVRYAAGTAITNLRNPGTAYSNTYYTKNT